MSRNLALGLFLATSIMLAVLLLIQAIKPLDGGAVFAIALLLFGGLSRGFRGGKSRPAK
jgi:preprotein translocase subunit SecG